MNFLKSGVLWLAVLLAPGALAQINLSRPRDYQVVQRATRATGTIIISGTVAPRADALETRLIGTNFAGGDLPGNWQPLPFDPRIAAFRGQITAPAGGWYRLEVRATLKGLTVAETNITHVGVGEVFVVAGQSNAANYGEERQSTATGLVAAFDGNTWRLANDPQPGAGGSGGSFMPPFGDAVAQQLHIPVGIVAQGIGATSVREWLPAGVRFHRPPTITHNVVTVGSGEWEADGKIFAGFSSRLKSLGPQGFRAVLWHQGESDAHQADPTRTLPGEDYRRYLESLITASRQEIGWPSPWFVAQVSYHIPTDTGDPAIRAAQKAVCDDGLALPGPDTDSLIGDRRENHGNGVHLSAVGLREHAQLWVDRVLPWLEHQLATEPSAPPKSNPTR